MESNSRRKELARRAVVGLLKGLATTAASIARPDTAAKKWLEKIYLESGEGSVRRRIEKEYHGSYIFLTLRSNPTSVVWGQVKKITWREHLDGDLVIKHPVHGYETPVNLNDIGICHLFDSKDELQWYAEEEFRDGNIREGSFKVTLEGAINYGDMILNSLIEYVNERNTEPIIIPQELAGVLDQTYKEFKNSTQGQRGALVNLFPKAIRESTEICVRYPFEFTIISMAVEYIFLMVRVAALSER